MTNESPRDGSDPPDPKGLRAGHAPEAVQSLRAAMRRARFDDAERVGALADLRETKIGRLELLQDALAPMLEQVPRDVDLFDVGIMPGSTPRLFIDMIGFVEMARDARIYRFLQDTRHNRVTIAETADIDTMVGVVTDYVARRLLERDKALASQASERDAAIEPAPWRAVEAAGDGRRPARRRPLRRATGLSSIVFAFIIDLLGAIAFFTILAGGAWFLWTRLHGQI